MVWVPCGWTRGDITRNTWERPWERVLDTVPPLRLTDFHLFKIAVGTSMWSILDIFINVAVPRKHCNTPLGGVLVELMSIMISNIFKVDWNFPNFEERFRLSFWSSGRSCFPATKENKTTHYAAYFTTVTCTLTETKRTLEYLVIHNEIRYACTFSVDSKMGTLTVC